MRKIDQVNSQHAAFRRMRKRREQLRRRIKRREGFLRIANERIAQRRGSRHDQHSHQRLIDRVALSHGIRKHEVRALDVLLVDPGSLTFPRLDARLLYEVSRLRADIDFHLPLLLPR